MIIDEYGGIVIEFIGDAILGIFGKPVVSEEHPTLAVKAAICMLEQLSVINKWLAERGLPELSIRAGVHTGRSLVGNMGFESRMKYGIVGEESEIPSRLEEMNKNFSTKLMISHATFARLVPDTFIVRPVDYVRLGSDERGQPIYEVMSRNRKSSRSEFKLRTAALHTEAMNLYRARQFREAAERFIVVRGQMRMQEDMDDQPSAMMIKRCKAYLENPPAPDWDGVWDRGSEPQ
mmetsp:Transcript_104912/g.313442  ORF Transcript_104912/g.313442 Transcript_104912/m.313442 type:complete len:234 (-) Transcript_104912:17-718(-)